MNGNWNIVDNLKSGTKHSTTIIFFLQEAKDYIVRLKDWIKIIVHILNLIKFTVQTAELYIM